MQEQSSPKAIAERIVRDAKAELEAFNYFWSRWPEDKWPEGCGTADHRDALLAESQQKLAKRYATVMKQLLLPGCGRADAESLAYVQSIWDNDEKLIDMVRHTLAIGSPGPKRQSVADRFESYT